MSDSKESQDAVVYAKKNYKILISQIYSAKQYAKSDAPFSIFMAGSPGAGKTEYSKSLLEELEKSIPSQEIIRLDTDELRELLPSSIRHLPVPDQLVMFREQ